MTNLDNGEHPFHLHGHNFWVVATSLVPDGEALYGPNFVRRDVISLPPAGWARIRFVADDPGVWVFHCHSARSMPVLACRVCMRAYLHAVQHCALTLHPRTACAQSSGTLHSGLVMTLVEAPSKLYAAGMSGELARSQGHSNTCRTYASASTIAGAGSGWVAPTRVVDVGADGS